MMMQYISTSDEKHVVAHTTGSLAAQGRSEDRRESAGASPITNRTIDAILEQYDFAYILSQVKHIVHAHIPLAHPGARDLELEDIAQEIFIRFWQKLHEDGEAAIQHPEAYIARMIRNRCIDTTRRYARIGAPQSLVLSDSGEILQGTILTVLSEGMSDPADELEQKERKADWCAQVAAAITALPARQKMAMLCLLLEQVDDLSQFLQALVCQGLSAYALWPENKSEQRLLKASLYAARQALARRLKIDLSQYKHSSRHCAPPGTKLVRAMAMC